MTVSRSGFLLLVLFSLSTYSFSQAPAKTAKVPPVPHSASDYSAEGVVVEHYWTKVRFDNDGTGEREVSLAAKMQAEAGVKEFAVLSFAYTSSTQSVDVDYVRVRKHDGTVVNTPTYNIQDMPADVTRNAPMYSDIHEKHIAVKALGVGDTLEYRIVFKTTKPELPGQFWFEQNFLKDVIVKDERLEISFPKDKFVNVSSTDVQPVISERNGQKVYTWTSNYLVRKAPNDKELPRRESPRPAVEISTFKTWDEIGAWYAELQKSQVTVTPEIKAKAEAITRGLTTDDQKLHALYSYVASKFHYVSLSFGIGRYQPHAADDVLGNEYGDCKDKHTLLASLLKAVGIDAWPALINSGRKIDADIPSPAAFDHVITAVHRGKDIVWLDTTSEVAPFGLLFLNLRGRKALVIPTTGNPSLMQTPEALPFTPSQLFEVEGKLDDYGTFTGHVKQVLRGDYEVILRQGFRQVPQAQWKELVQRFSYALGFGGEVSNVVATNPEDTAQPFEFSYDYVRKKYSDWDNYRITPPLPPFGIEVSETDERRPVEPFLLGAPGEVTYRARVELAPFYKTKAPENVDLVEDYAEYHAHYSIKDYVFKTERKFIIRKPEVAVAAWDKYRKFRQSILKDESQYADLNAADSTTDANSTDSTDGSEASAKYTEAVNALKGRDITKAEELLKNVIELDPKFQRAHLTLGQVYMFRNQVESAISEIKKEEEFHPEFQQSYIILASIYEFSRRENEALDQYKLLLKVDPSNRDGALRASMLLQQQKKYAEMAELLEPAAKIAPDSSALNLQLARAYLATGKKDDAVALIKKSVNEQSPSAVLNNAAYYLAETGVALDLAREYSELSLKKLEAGFSEDSVTDATAVLRTAQVSTCWDTLGWVYFRSGDLQKAAMYIKPAWELAQHAAVGDHLAQVYRKQGKLRESEHMFRLAYAAVKQPGDRDAILQHYKAMTGKSFSPQISSHRLPGGTWSPMPGEELSRMRTTKFLSDRKSTSNATFSLVLSPGKVESARYVEGAEELKSLADKLKSEKLALAFPDLPSPLKIVRRGIVTCDSSGCSLTYLLPDGGMPNFVGF